MEQYIAHYLNLKKYRIYILIEKKNNNKFVNSHAFFLILMFLLLHFNVIMRRAPLHYPAEKQSNLFYSFI